MLSYQPLIPMSKIIVLLKIAGGMLVSYLVVATIGTQLFEVNSPKINMQYIASLRETPSKVWVSIASLGSMFNRPDTQKQMEEFAKKTGATEIAVSAEELKTVAKSLENTTNPLPNAVFNYVSQGVATAKAAEEGEIIMRIDPKTNIEYRRFIRKDGTVLEIMILK